MSRTILTIIAFAAILTSPLAAQAQTRAEQISTRVFYGDLDLSKPAGLQTLRGRLKAASLQVCGDARGALRVARIDPAQCSQNAIAGALAAIGKSRTRVVADNNPKPAD
jgi:UrcA family protein